MKRQLSRRDFLKFAGFLSVTSLAAAGTGAFTFSLLNEPDVLEVTEVTIKLPRLTPRFYGFRIAQISDIHMGAWMNAERLRRVVDLVKAQKPELVAITGDFFTGPVWNQRQVRAADELVAEISRLTEEIPAVGVLGNHDHWSDAEEVRSALARCGVIEIGNSFHTIERDGQQLHIAGVDDIWYDHDDLDEVLSRLPESGEAILLAHEPDFADESAVTGRFGLQLSGHSHGGQIVLPVVGAPVLPRLGKKYPSGLYKVQDMWQYTNRGVGMLEPAVRINCRPEITVFTLEPV
jgi:predicted MPP superfamily phosphohydrolase